MKLAILAATNVTAALLGFAVSHYSGANVDPVPTVAGPYDGCACTEQAMQIAWSLDNQGQQWESDSYVASRRGVYIWVANGDRNLSVGSSRDQVVSGMSWKPELDDRALIARAYQRWSGIHSVHAWDIRP